MLANLNSCKLKDGPPHSIRGWRGGSRTETESSSQPKPDVVASLIETTPVPEDSNTGTSSCPIRVSDATTSSDKTDRYDDGSNYSIVSPKLAEQAVIEDISQMTAIPPE